MAYHGTYLKYGFFAIILIAIFALAGEPFQGSPNPMLITGNAITLEVNLTEISVEHHIQFEQNFPKRCKDGIFVTDGQYNIPFKTYNEKYENGLCKETDIEFENYVFYSSSLLSGFSVDDKTEILKHIVGDDSEGKSDILEQLTEDGKKDIIEEIAGNTSKTDIIKNVKDQVTTTVSTTTTIIETTIAEGQNKIIDLILLEDEYVELPPVNITQFSDIPDNQPRLVIPKNTTLPYIPTKTYVIMAHGWVE